MASKATQRESVMIKGKGVLVLRDQRRIPVEYQFGGNHDDTRVGYLVFDTSELDPGVLLDRLTVDCDDGTDLTIAVMHSSDRHLAVIGRVVQSASPPEAEDLNAKPVNRAVA
jgi:hypothetical protein